MPLSRRWPQRVPTGMMSALPDPFGIWHFQEASTLALWLTALKIIPWGDVIEAAPGIAKSARKYFAGTQSSAPSPAASDSAVAPGDALAQARARLAQLETTLAQLTAQQQASAALIESLADQNAKVVQAIDILRVRTRLLIWVVAVLAAAVVFMAVGWGA